MFDAYSRYRALHELMALLELAIDRMSPKDARLLIGLRDLIDDFCESGRVMEGAVPINALRRLVWTHVRKGLALTSPVPYEADDDAGAPWG